MPVMVMDQCFNVGIIGSNPMAGWILKITHSDQDAFYLSELKSGREKYCCLKPPCSSAMLRPLQIGFLFPIHRPHGLFVKPKIP